MQATDLQPTRLEAAKTAAKAFVDVQPSAIKIGLVAFNNGALITQQPTTDRADALSAIDRLQTAGATSLGQGIFAALTAIAGKPIPLPDDLSPADLDASTSGTTGPPPSCCCPTERTRRGGAPRSLNSRRPPAFIPSASAVLPARSCRSTLIVANRNRRANAD
jgi:hypothetical protein